MLPVWVPSRAEVGAAGMEEVNLTRSELPLQTFAKASIMITLILGGASSGKSEFAEKFVQNFATASEFNGTKPLFCHYIATSQVRFDDPEMQAKIARHQARRGTEWQTDEVALDLSKTLAELSQRREPILVECLSMWVNNLMEAGREIDQASHELITACEKSDAPIIFVSLEVGLGIVPDNALARQYRDALGTLNQKIAAIADNVILVVAGQPLYIKGHK